MQFPSFHIAYSYAARITVIMHQSQPAFSQSYNPQFSVTPRTAILVNKKNPTITICYRTLEYSCLHTVLSH
uniref:Uncharacterized protein n=1 Tax=Arundo donax TaxID=35708 RepID=A0A0A9HKT2_ARUDO